jgi:hypothetical protein
MKAKLTTIAITLHSIIDCEHLKVYESTWFRHMMFKTYQSITNNDKVFVELKNVTVKEI